MTILVIVHTVSPHRRSEALRSALGLTLRGSSVEVAIDGPLTTPLARRAAETLRAFGHSVGPLDGNALTAAVARACRVEVWT